MSSLKEQVVIDDHGVAFKTFPNGRVLSLRSATSVFLSDDHHRLKPVASFDQYADEEGRTSVKISLRLGRMPASSGWGGLSDAIELRSYPAGRSRFDRYEDLAENQRLARDKLKLHGNLTACLPEEQRASLSHWTSVTLRRDTYGTEDIPDDVWNPCQEFALAALRGMKEGEFPDFSLLSSYDIKDRYGDRVSFAPLESVLAYDGLLKDCE